jgi:hypothetical protein
MAQPKMGALEDAAKRLNAFMQSGVAEQLQGANEAKTRLLVIDEILAILGWAKEEYEPELPSSSGGYTDYRLSIEGQGRLIVEAKRSGTIKALPKSIRSTKYSNSFLFKNYGPEMQALLQQCTDYCRDCGIPYALATTGDIWIVVLGFKYGIEWGKLQSYVWHSLEDLRSRFAEFFGLVARESVKNNSLEELFGSSILVNPQNPVRPRDRVEADADASTSPHRQTVELFFSHFMEDITKPNQADMLNHCYVHSRNLDGYSRELQQILDYDAILDEQDTRIEPVDEEKLENELESQLELTKPKTILLVGNIGSGKSTFVHRFIEFEARPRKNICVVVDLINEAIVQIQNGRDEEQRLARLVLKRLEVELGGKEDPFDPTILRLCFEPEVARFRKQRATLFSTNINSYRIQEDDYLSVLCGDAYAHLIGFINYVSKKKYKPWIAFDNVDRGSDSYQEFVYGFAHKLSSEARCVTLITLREDTFKEAQAAGFLDVRTSDKVFRISAPEFGQVVSKRRKYVEYLIDNGGLPGTLKRRVNLIQRLNWHIKNLVTGENNTIRVLISTLSLQNIRDGFAMMREYYLSRHSTFSDETVARLEASDQKRTFDFEKEYSRFIQALMLGDRWSYSEADSDIFNLFSVDPTEQSSHFLMLRILYYLRIFKNTNSSRISIKAERLLRDLVLLGHPRHHVNLAIRRLLAGRLIVSQVFPAV